MPTLNPELKRLLLGAYQRCPEFGGTCHDMRWQPQAGHVPRGFCGATGEVEDVTLVLVMAEPGDPHPEEVHAEEPDAALQSTYDYSCQCYQKGRDLFHRNVRKILDLCFPGMSFDDQMRRTWMTESVLCSAITEGAPVRGPVEKVCRVRYLDQQLNLFPNAVVAALGGKAAKRLPGA